MDKLLKTDIPGPLRDAIFNRTKIRLYWMSLSVLLIGILSIILLLWVDRIRERHRNNCSLMDTIEEAEINVATSHLWLEQALARDGKGPSDSNQALADLDKAINLMDLTLKGGKTEHGLISVPLKDPELRAQAEIIKTLLLKFKMFVELRLQKNGETGSGSALDLQSHPIFREILSKASNLEDLVEANKEKDREKSTRLLLLIISTWTVVMITTTTGLWFLETRRRSAETALLKANEKLFSQAEELIEHREYLGEQVKKRTAELTAANLLLRDEISVRRFAEEALKETGKQVQQLSSQRQAVQELERRRISRELHDGLGQSLNVMKLRMRFIEQRLHADQEDVRRDCEELLEYTSQVIEDVRRLSHDLSPAILSDLGLTSALRWLTNNFTKNQPIKAKLDLVDIDDLFDENNRIGIYRIIQELFANIAKHSQAGQVSLVIRREGDSVIFEVEDDGKGFDPDMTRKDNGETGLGLASINERVKILGGQIDMRSGEGKGTRVTFSIPVGHVEV